MTKIIFRARNYETGKMVYGGYGQYTEEVGIIYQFDGESRTYKYLVKNSTLEMYHGEDIDSIPSDLWVKVFRDWGGE